LLRLELAHEPQRRDLALVLVAVVPARHEHGRAVAVADRRDRDEAVRPAARVRDLRELEASDVLARRGEVDRAGDRRLVQALLSSTVVTAASVASSSRSTSSSLCA